MPDRRKHRGAAPGDDEIFSPSKRAVLAAAVAHLSWLLSRGYAEASALKLVGDRFRLVTRQRTAVLRCACSDEALERRSRRRLPIERLKGPLLLDGYNVLTTLEAALAGGVLLVGRDGCLRDMASMHGSYRKVAESVPALELAGSFLADRGVGPCIWYLDRPVSNSGRLKRMLVDLAVERGWDWKAETVADPDPLLAASGEVVATADGLILDRCRTWINLVREVVLTHVPTAWVLDLSREPEGEAGTPAPRVGQRKETNPRTFHP